jgi:hypothetical protein
MLEVEAGAADEVLLGAEGLREVVAVLHKYSKLDSLHLVDFRIFWIWFKPKGIIFCFWMINDNIAYVYIIVTVLKLEF